MHQNFVTICFVMVVFVMLETLLNLILHCLLFKCSFRTIVVQVVIQLSLNDNKLPVIKMMLYVAV